MTETCEILELEMRYFVLVCTINYSLKIVALIEIQSFDLRYISSSLYLSSIQCQCNILRNNAEMPRFPAAYITRRIV
jgi:hypothetical protein